MCPSDMRSKSSITTWTCILQCEYSDGLLLLMPWWRGGAQACVQHCLEKHVTTSSSILISLKWFIVQTFKRKFQIPQICLGILRWHYKSLAWISEVLLYTALMDFIMSSVCSLLVKMRPHEFITAWQKFNPL